MPSSTVYPFQSGVSPPSDRCRSVRARASEGTYRARETPVDDHNPSLLLPFFVSSVPSCSPVGQRDRATSDRAGPVGAQDGEGEERHRTLPKDARREQDPTRHRTGTNMERPACATCTYSFRFAHGLRKVGGGRGGEDAALYAETVRPLVLRKRFGMSSNVGPVNVNVVPTSLLLAA